MRAAPPAQSGRCEAEVPPDPQGCRMSAPGPPASARPMRGRRGNAAGGPGGSRAIASPSSPLPCLARQAAGRPAGRPGSRPGLTHRRFPRLPRARWQGLAGIAASAERQAGGGGWGRWAAAAPPPAGAGARQGGPPARRREAEGGGGAKKAGALRAFEPALGPAPAGGRGAAP